MTRQPTPTNLLDNALPAPSYNLAAVMTAAPEVDLYFDYAGLGVSGAAIREHAIAIKLCGKRRAEATVDAGEHLIAVKESIPHGQWEPWLREELGMDERTGQKMMEMARRFGSKARLISLLSPTVLGLLSPPSAPDAAVDAAIAAAAASPVTVTAAKAIIAAHKAAGRCRKCGRTLTDPAAAANGIGACCAAKLARAGGNGYTEPEAVEDKPLLAWAVEPEINVTMHPHATAPATIAQTVADVMEVYGYTPADDATIPVAPDFAPIPPATHSANATPAPQPAPPRGDSVVVGMDGRTEALGRLAMRLNDLIGVMRELGQSYGEATGDFTTPREVRHGLEKMQVKVRANQEQGEGWE